MLIVYYNMNNPSNKLLPLESLRGIAAIIVSLLHFQPAASLLLAIPLIRNGSLMVDFFFVLSGFVIALNYSDKLNTFLELWRFQKKRFWRLYPLHAITLIAFICLETARTLSGISLQKPSSIDALLSHIFLVQSMNGNHATFNVPSWSISVEFYTYLFFALIMMTRIRLWIIILVILYAYFYLNIAQPNHPLDGPPDTLFLRCVFGFFIGTIALNISKFVPKLNFSVIPIGLLLLSVFAVSMFGETQFNIYVPLLFATAIISISKLGELTLLHRLLSYPTLVWMGSISYSIYMLHGLVWAIVGTGIRFISPTTVVDGVRVFHLSSWAAGVVTFLSVVLLLFLSNQSFKLIELRFKNGATKAR